MACTIIPPRFGGMIFAYLVIIIITIVQMIIITIIILIIIIMMMMIIILIIIVIVFIGISRIHTVQANSDGKEEKIVQVLCGYLVVYPH